jgi:hypothetical protein
MNPPALDKAIVVLILAAVSYTIAHGARLVMRRASWPVWLAGTVFGFLAFLANRAALAGAAWLIYTGLFARSPDPLTLLALVGLASTPLLLSFVNVTPFYGPGVLVLLYVITWIRLTSLSSLALGMDWLGCLGWWTAAWIVVAGLGYGLRWLTRDIRWLGWTGMIGRFLTSPQELMPTLPGFHVERRAIEGAEAGPRKA